MHSLLVSIQKPDVAEGGDKTSAIGRWQTAVDSVKPNGTSPESYLELGAGCWLLKTQDAAPLLGAIVEAVKEPRLSYKILVAENVTEWSYSFPIIKSSIH
ncbi:MAG TPA: hypothetical protein VIK28_04175 [Sedimentisphaerales bacterium]